MSCWLCVSRGFHPIPPSTETRDFRVGVTGCWIDMKPSPCATTIKAGSKLNFTIPSQIPSSPCKAYFKSQNDSGSVSQMDCWIPDHANLNVRSFKRSLFESNWPYSNSHDNLVCDLEGELLLPQTWGSNTLIEDFGSFGDCNNHLDSRADFSSSAHGNKHANAGSGKGANPVIAFVAEESKRTSLSGL